MNTAPIAETIELAPGVSISYRREAGAEKGRTVLSLAIEIEYGPDAREKVSQVITGLDFSYFDALRALSERHEPPPPIERFDPSAPTDVMFEGNPKRLFRFHSRSEFRASVRSARNGRKLVDRYGFRYVWTGAPNDERHGAHSSHLWIETDRGAPPPEPPGPYLLFLSNGSIVRIDEATFEPIGEPRRYA